MTFGQQLGEHGPVTGHIEMNGDQIYVKQGKVNISKEILLMTGMKQILLLIILLLKSCISLRLCSNQLVCLEYFGLPAVHPN